ncbi:MAG: LysR substrate-binding domain-containing protein, partial [Deltaproteobacteria bacterium]
FVTFAEVGSLARTAQIVGRTPSAVTAQMQRLEGVLGEPLLSAAGRGRILTPAGERFVGHARRILTAHRDAWLSMKGAASAGTIRLGCTQDFADSGLPDLLRSFVRGHPLVQIDLRIGRSGEITTAYAQNDIDIALTMRAGPARDEIAVLREPMLWLADPNCDFARDDVLPLAVLDPPCDFRSAAIDALDTAQKPYRIAATSPSLSGLAAAVRSGIAITARTARMIAPGIAPASVALELPNLPTAEFSLRANPQANQSTRDFAERLAEGIAP